MTALALTVDEYVFGCLKCSDYHAFGQAMPGMLCPKCRSPLTQLWHTSIPKEARMTPKEKDARAKKDEQNKAKRQVTVALKVLSGITPVAKYRGSNGKSIHTVETDGSGGLQCTCQGFRIHKMKCKHIRMFEANGDRGILDEE